MSLLAQRTPCGNIMEFTCTMLITSQCFSMYFFMAAVVWANLILSSIYISLLSHPVLVLTAFILDTLSGKLKHYLYMFVLMSKVRKLMFLFCLFLIKVSLAVVVVFLLSRPATAA